MALCPLFYTFLNVQPTFYVKYSSSPNSMFTSWKKKLTSAFEIFSYEFFTFQIDIFGEQGKMNGEVMSQRRSDTNHNPQMVASVDCGRSDL